MVPPIFESTNAPGGKQIAHKERGQKFDVELAEQVRCACVKKKEVKEFA
jgi:hypothetical protein